MRETSVTVRRRDRTERENKKEVWGNIGGTTEKDRGRGGGKR